MNNNEMYSKVEFVSVEWAKELLQTNPRNRTIKKINKSKLVKALLEGHFELTHQGIAIDKNGKLIDGHHRLEAIVETGIGVYLYVTYNAPNSTYIDSGASRRQQDAAYMNGLFEKGTPESNCLTYPLINFIYYRNHGRKNALLLSPDDKHMMYQYFQRYIDPIIDIANRATSKGSKGRSSVVLYAMVCAYAAGVPFAVLEKWHYIVTTGDFFDQDNDMVKAGRSILQFKNFLNNKPNSGFTGGPGYQEEILKKAESSIRHYHQKNHVTKLYGEFCYPDLVIPDYVLHKEKAV